MVVFMPLCIMVVFSASYGGALSQPRECSDMNDLVHKLPYFNMSQLQCETSQDCSSLHCRNTTHRDLGFGLTIVSCDEEPILYLEVNLPSLGILSWAAHVGDGSFLPINGFNFPSSSMKQGFVETNVKKTSAENAIIFSVTVKGCELNYKRIFKQSCAEKQVIAEQKLVCTNQIKRQTLCSIFKLFDCPPNETCRQIGETSKGECICDDERKNIGKCGSSTSHDTAASTPTPPSQLVDPLIPIVVSFTICVIGVVVFYLIMKLKVFQRARAALTRNRFRRLLVEDVVFDD